MEEQKNQEQEQNLQSEETAAEEQQVENAQEQAQEQEEIDYFSEMLEDLTDEERQNFFEDHGKGVMNRYFDRELTEAEAADYEDALEDLGVIA